MRPRSIVRLELHAALIDGGGITRTLAQRTGRSIEDVREALNNLVRAGEVHKPRDVRMPGVKRPVPWYERAPLQPVDDDAEQPLIALANAWRSPAAVVGAMGHQPLEAGDM